MKRITTASVRIWNLNTGKPIDEPLTGPGSVISAVVGAKRGDGVPIILSGGNDYNVSVQSLDTGQSLGGPFTGHADVITGLATGRLRKDGTPIVVSSSLDETDTTVEPEFIGRPFGHRPISLEARWANKFFRLRR